MVIEQRLLDVHDRNLLDQSSIGLNCRKNCEFYEKLAGRPVLPGSKIGLNRIFIHVHYEFIIRDNSLLIIILK